MALALYRKYRPRTFAEIIGQEHVTEPLSQALRSGRLNHAYLFSGPRGCGKTSSARILARSLNCERGPTPEPCGECASCRALAPDGPGSIDVIEIDAASHGGVDDARDLREKAIYAPVSSRFKVYVIDEAHMVSSAGFNALLKLVEEPPDYVKFVFATTEPEKVLGTIKSRTHHYPFRLIPPGVLRPYLEQLCSSEGVKVEPAVFPLVVRAGGGSARDTLSILDQLIAGAGADGVSYARAVGLLGVTDVALIDEMCDGLAAGDGRTAYGVIDRVVEAGHDPRRFASDLLERLRDLIVLQQVPDAVTKGLLDAPEDQLERMGSQASRLGAASLSRFADIVHNGLTEMRGTTAPRLLLELVAARMLLPGADESTGGLLQRLERLERRLTASDFSQGQNLPRVPAEPLAPQHPTGPAAQATPAHRAPGPDPQSPQPPSPQPPSPQPQSPQPPGTQPPGPQPQGQQPFSAPSPQTQPQSAEPLRTEPAHARPAHAEPQSSAEPQSGAEPQGAHPVSPQPAQTAQAQAPAPRPPAAPGTIDVMAVRQVWEDVLSIVSKRNKKTAALVREANIRDVEGDTLVLLFKHTVHATMLSNSPDTLVEALTELIGGRWKIRCEVGEAGGGTAGRTAPAPSPSPAPTQGSGARSLPDQDRPPQQSPSADSRAPRTAAPVALADDDWPMPAQPGGTPAPPAPSQPQPAPAQATPAPTQSSSAAARPTQRAAGTMTDHAQPPPAAPTVTPQRDYPTPPSAASLQAPTPPTPPAMPEASPRTPSAATETIERPAPVEDWPATTALGTTAAATTATTPATKAPAKAGTPGKEGPRRGSAVEQARAAAARAGTSRVRKPAESTWEGAPDEPPWDPDYDGPVGADPAYPGFDPGDEPMDDASPGTRETSEEAALRLLTEALGAEKISETGN